MYIYISGPISSDRELHTDDAIEIAELVVERGHTPFLPHLYLFWHDHSGHPYEYWMKLDLAWIHRCDALLRLPGESPGADREVELAKELDKIIYYDLKEII